METNRDYEQLCRDVFDIVEEQSDAVYEMQLAMCARNEARPVEEWSDEDQDFLRELDRVEEQLDRAVRLLDGVERELRLENYRFRFGNGSTPRNEHRKSNEERKTSNERTTAGPMDLSA